MSAGRILFHRTAKENIETSIVTGNIFLNLLAQTFLQIVVFFFLTKADESYIMIGVVVPNPQQGQHLEGVGRREQEVTYRASCEVLQ